jgi:ketosteroid isomerase-like protein
MKKLFMILPLVLLLCVSFGCQQAEEVAEEPAVDVEADVKAIKSLIDDTSRAWYEGDYEGYMETIDEEAMFLSPNYPAIEGLETLRSIYQTELGSNNYELTITTEEILVSGDLAYSLGIWKGTVNPKDGSEPYVFNNKNLVIYKRQVDGSWKVFRAMYNSNTPSETE